MGREVNGGSAVAGRPRLLGIELITVFGAGEGNDGRAANSDLRSNSENATGWALRTIGDDKIEDGLVRLGSRSSRCKAGHDGENRDEGFGGEHFDIG